MNNGVTTSNATTYFLNFYNLNNLVDHLIHKKNICDTNSFNPFYTRSIFDWRTPYGYLFAFIFGFIGATYLTLQPTYLCSQGFGLFMINVGYFKKFPMILKLLYVP